MPGIRELRADLAAHVRRASAGARIPISSGGRLVAELGPPHRSGESTLDALVGRGLLIPPRRTDQRTAAGRVSVYANVRFDRLMREIRG